MRSSGRPYPAVAIPDGTREWNEYLVFLKRKSPHLYGHPIKCIRLYQMGTVCPAPSCQVVGFKFSVGLRSARVVSDH